MKKFYLYIILLLPIVLLLSSCTYKKSTSSNQSNNSNAEQIKTTKFSEPKEIIYYNNGQKTVINKEDEKFNGMVSATEKMIEGIKDQYGSTFPIGDLKNKGKLLEYDYSEKQVLEYTTSKGTKRTITYTKLYFDVNKGDSISNLMAFEGEGYGPVGPLGSNDELLKLLNK
ncbi:hypothetical protein [Clostridium folliculivorans]|uniref:hypothetical protein n=1 Tax=Clostridium folliculivorans TaxID=2886038 RepID=UPI0021C366E3|nr:hypothetical protein [Clostridium folliculivorans]GKU30162.1 hypothetical protein CFB3_22690 [Clostridium folliculivorans]